MKASILMRTAVCGAACLPALAGLGSLPAHVQAAETAVPVFSQESGFYTGTFDLTLTAPEGCTIYYTLDGSDPTAASRLYDGPIPVCDRTPEANVISEAASRFDPPKEPVDKATVVRAAAYDAAGNLSRTVTKTYFVGYEQDDFLFRIPVISLVTDPDNLFHEETGIYVFGTAHGADWNGLPNFMQHGREWERPAHITVFENGNAVYSTDTGIRIHGNSSSTFTQKSFKLYSRSEYGSRKFDYDFFHGSAEDVNGKVISSFNHLILRNGGNDSILRLRDRLHQEMAAGRSFGTQEMTECIVFLDGEFWGLYNITEKLNESYVAAHYHVKKDSVCLIKDALEYIEEDTKGLEDYKDLIALADSGLSGADAYDRVAAVVDMKSFAEYMAAELIIANADFNDNNIALWKTDTIDSSNPYADGKWRFLMFDTEMIAFEADHDMIARTNTSAAWNYRLLYGLLENSARFRREFAEAYFSICDENFNSERVLKRLDELWPSYQEPLAETYDRFSGYFGEYAEENTDDALNEAYHQLRTYWESRADYAKMHLTRYLRTMAATGNVNGDQRTDKKDAELLRDWLLCKPDAVPAEGAAGDLNANDKLDAADLTLLKQMLLA